MPQNHSCSSLRICVCMDACIYIYFLHILHDGGGPWSEIRRSEAPAGCLSRYIDVCQGLLFGLFKGVS